MLGTVLLVLVVAHCKLLHICFCIVPHCCCTFRAHTVNFLEISYRYYCEYWRCCSNKGISHSGLNKSVFHSYSSIQPCATFQSNKTKRFLYRFNRKLSVSEQHRWFQRSSLWALVWIVSGPGWWQLQRRCASQHSCTKLADKFGEKTTTTTKSWKMFTRITP